MGKNTNAVLNATINTASFVIEKYKISGSGFFLPSYFPFESIEVEFYLFPFYLYRMNTIDPCKRADCTKWRNTEEGKDFPDASNSIGVESYRWKPLVELWNIFQTSQGNSELLASGFPWFRSSTFHRRVSAACKRWPWFFSLAIARWYLNIVLYADALSHREKFVCRWPRRVNWKSYDRYVSFTPCSNYSKLWLHVLSPIVAHRNWILT